MKNPDVGVTPPEDAERDAIHVAVIPVIAGEILKPGEHVGRISKDRFGKSSDYCLGIVDPFLKGKVRPDQRFWLFLYPKTVTSIRHHWMHDAFPEFSEKEKEADLILSANKEQSEAWLRAYAENHYATASNGNPYEALLQDLRENSVIYRGEDMHSREELENESELKHHAEIVLGFKIDFDDPNFTFSCSC